MQQVKFHIKRLFRTSCFAELVSIWRSIEYRAFDPQIQLQLALKQDKMQKNKYIYKSFLYLSYATLVTYVAVLGA